MESVPILFLLNRYGVSRPTIGNWVREKPSIKVGNNQYNLGECDLYVIEVKDNEIKKLKSANGKDNDRLYLANCEFKETETALKKLELAQKQGLLVPLDEVVQDIEASFTSVQVKLMGLPDRLALELSGMQEPSQIRERLEQIMRETLEDLNSQFQSEDENTSEL